MPASGQSSPLGDRKSAAGTARSVSRYASPSKGGQGACSVEPDEPGANGRIGDQPQTQLIRECLDKILNSGEFKTTPQLRTFLQFIVDAALKDRKQDLKGHIIAVEALGRGPGFDPNTDPIVRVEAARLRTRLSNYYSGSGTSDPIQISVPKGGYEPVFEEVSDQPASDELAGQDEHGQLVTNVDRTSPTTAPALQDSAVAKTANLPRSHSFGTLNIRPRSGTGEQDEVLDQNGPALSQDGSTAVNGIFSKVMTRPRFSIFWFFVASMGCFLAGYLTGSG